MKLTARMCVYFEENATYSQEQEQLVVTSRTLSASMKHVLTVNVWWIRHSCGQEVNMGNVFQTSWWSMLRVSC